MPTIPIVIPVTIPGTISGPVTVSGELDISGKINVSGVLNVLLADNPSGGGTPWTPTELGAAVRAWYQFDLLTGSNGDPQGSVTDSSGNGFTLTQTGTNRAILAVADQNSLNTLRFTAANSQYYPMSNTALAGLTAGSFYIVYKGVATGTNYTLLNAGRSGQDSHYPYSDDNYYNDFGSTARKSVGASTNAVTAYRSLSIYSASNDWAFFVDGGTGGSSGGTLPLSSTLTNTVDWLLLDTFKIGSNNAANNFLDGWIAELIFTNAKQSDADRQKVEGYLAWKWGIQGNLDTTHPYKNAAPTV